MQDQLLPVTITLHYHPMNYFRCIKGFIETIKIATILNTMGQLFDENELQALIDENDPDSK